jgi:membrane AbrB-like protein
MALFLGILGGLVAVRFNIPSGDLVAPIVVLGAINLLGAGLGPMPEVFRWAAMLFIGISVGAQMSRESLRKLRLVAVPALLMVATLIAAGILLGWGLSLVTPLDTTTALLSAVPGGASIMPIIAHDLGGDFRLVAALQLVRQLVMLVLVPATLGFILNARRRGRIVAPNL